MTTHRRVLAAMARCGGVCDYRTLVSLVSLTSRRALHAALRAQVIRRERRGRYALPSVDDGLRTAHRLCAVLSHTSAAAHWGWAMKSAPERPWVTVPRNRKVPAVVRDGARVSWRTVDADEVRDGLVTSPLRTVLDCALTLPFDEALVIADSVLRSGDVSAAALRTAAELVRGPGRARVLRVAREASPRAANPFESVLRAISLDIPGLDLRPQVEISEPGFFARPDLVDARRRLVVEADSYEFHAERRRSLVVDCARYTNLVVRGWTVL